MVVDRPYMVSPVESGMAYVFHRGSHLRLGFVVELYRRWEVTCHEPGCWTWTRRLRADACSDLWLHWVHKHQDAAG